MKKIARALFPGLRMGELHRSGAPRTIQVGKRGRLDQKRLSQSARDAGGLAE